MIAAGTTALTVTLLNVAVIALDAEIDAGTIDFGAFVIAPENAEVALIAATASTSAGAIANEMYACGEAPVRVQAKVPTDPAAARAPSVTPKPPPPPLFVSKFARDASADNEAFVQTGT